MPHFKTFCRYADQSYSQTELMNRFQATAEIMAILREKGRLQPGTQEYKLARKIVSNKIDTLGPDAALKQAIALKAKFLEQKRVEDILDDVREKFPHLHF